MDNAIPISDNQKAFVANGIYRAITVDIPEIIADYNLSTSLGSGQFRWNFIIRNLSENLIGDFESCVRPRGAWKILLLRDKNTNLSFSIMSEANFRRVQCTPKDKLHYLRALVLNNENYGFPMQQTFFSPESKCDDVDALCNLRNQLLGNFTGMVEEHVLVLFDSNFSGVISARAVLLTPELEIAVSEDWTKFLRSTAIPQDTLLSELLTDDEVFVALKPQFDADSIALVKPAEKSAEKALGK